MSTLLIVESPSKAKTLKKYLGDAFEVLASYGHVRDLVPQSGAIDVAQDFAMKYEVIAKNSKHVRTIEQAVKHSKAVYLATDPDREGEAISWHIQEILDEKGLLKGKTLKRVVFHEITRTAVQQAIKSPRDILMPLVNAQQARRALDYLVGFNLSPLLWKKIRRGLSAGRVQSPALRLIVEREQEIEQFLVQEYWTIHLQSSKAQQSFEAKLVQLNGKKVEQFTVVSQEQQATIVGQLLVASSGKTQVIAVERKEKKRHPAPPFTTSTLQQEAARKLGFSTSRTMRIAQQLYEGVQIGSGLVGLITYMRTDSTHLAAEAVRQVRDYIQQHFDPPYLPNTVLAYKTKVKNAQEAHEAIRPTDIFRTPDSVERYLTHEQHQLYSLVWKRLLACQMTQARFDTVSVDIAAGDEKNVFRATGQTMIFPGFMSVYLEGTDDAGDDEEKRQLPALTVGDVLSVEKIYGTQHFTEPPPRYSEASLVKTLENFGIGRPSTYASIISTLQDREYAVIEQKRFKPTDVGRVVNQFLTEHFTQYIDYHFTAGLEDELDAVAEGSVDWRLVLRNFWQGFHQRVVEKNDVSRPGNEVLDELCPKCGHALSQRLGRRGLFIGCTQYPECDYTRGVGESEASVPSEPVVIGTDPASGLAILSLVGPYGPYLQLGETIADAKKKPKRVSIPREISPTTLTLDMACKLIALPCELGEHPATHKKIMLGIGRFGPYVHHDGAYKSIPKAESLFDLSLERAVELLQQSGKQPLHTLGTHPEGGEVHVYAGRYGPYVKHGKVNATLPSGVEPDQLTLADVLPLLVEKAKKSKTMTSRSGGVKSGRVRKSRKKS